MGALLSGTEAMVHVPGLLAQSAIGDVPTRLPSPGLVGLSTQVPEELSVRGGVVALRTEGRLLEMVDRMASSQSHAPGVLVYRRFTQVANLLPAAYAAIVVEDSLDEPAALRADPRSLVFRDFFVAYDAFGEEALSDPLV